MGVGRPQIPTDHQSAITFILMLEVIKDRIVRSLKLRKAAGWEHKEPLKQTANL